MGIPDGAHTHGHGGGSGLGTAVLVLFGAALAVKLAGPVLDAATELLRVLLIAAGVIVGVGAASLAGLIAWRWRSRKTRPAPCPRERWWRGPPGRSRRRGERPNYPLRPSVNHPAAFIFTSMASPPRTLPPSSTGGMSRERRHLLGEREPAATVTGDRGRELPSSQGGVRAGRADKPASGKG
jgi:hypothetical protein